MIHQGDLMHEIAQACDMTGQMRPDRPQPHDDDMTDGVRHLEVLRAP